MGFFVSAPTYLYQSASGYIFRLRIPNDLRNIVGRVEFRYSLRTGALRIAKHRARSIASYIHLLFTRVRSSMSEFIQEKIQDLVKNYIKNTLANDEKCRAMSGPTATGSTTLEGMTLLESSDMKADEARSLLTSVNRWLQYQDHSLMKPVADKLIKAQGDAVDSESETYKSLSRELMLMNTAMKLERSRHLNADLYARKSDRIGYANGYKAKTVRSRFGEVHLAVPQTRGTDFYPQSLERGLRSERALKLALAEMYVQGVSTRKVAKVTEELCGFSVSSSEVSRASQALDEQLQAWRTRDLDAFPYVYLDARYEKVRHGGVVVSSAVLVAVGVSATGRREVLGTSVKLSEHEVHWREFLTSLKDRGLYGVRLFISDAHEGLKAARRAVFPTVPWQRCQFHLQQNAQQYVPRQSMKREVAEGLRSVFTAPTEQEALRLLHLFLEEYREKAPDLTAWAETAVPEGLEVMKMPKTHRRRLRTVNMVERLNKEIKRRTRVATMFPNTDSCLRLVTAVAMEISEEWETGKAYLSFD